MTLAQIRIKITRLEQEVLRLEQEVLSLKEELDEAITNLNRHK